MYTALALRFHSKVRYCIIRYTTELYLLSFFYKWNIWIGIIISSGPTVVGYGLEGALKFGFYETFKILFVKLTPSKFFNFLMASVVAGAVASMVLVRRSWYYLLYCVYFIILHKYLFSYCSCNSSCERREHTNYIIWFYW